MGSFTTLHGGKVMMNDKTTVAIKTIQYFEPPEGYYLAFSGGKDSITIKDLAIQAGVKFEPHYNVTTIDPPDLIYFIKEHHSDTIFDFPTEPFLRKMVKKGFPLRQKRWCCEHYKENWGSDRYILTGIRSGESYQRKGRQVFEHCLKGGYKGKNKHFVNAIIDWTDDDVWNYIKERNLPYCTLYDEGWKRIGCLFCPNAGKKARRVQAERYPTFRKAFVKAFEALYENRKSRGMTSVDRWKDGEEMFQWWINA
jgi:phosphoadenosine phosphosulfate reductase